MIKTCHEKNRETADEKLRTHMYTNRSNFAIIFRMICLVRVLWPWNKMYKICQKKSFKQIGFVRWRHTLFYYTIALIVIISSKYLKIETTKTKVKKKVSFSFSFLRKKKRMWATFYRQHELPTHHIQSNR